MGTLVLSTVIMALALLANLQPVMAQSGDEAAVAQAVEASAKPNSPKTGINSRRFARIR